jgi:hypothetical protein
MTATPDKDCLPPRVLLSNLSMPRPLHLSLDTPLPHPTSSILSMHLVTSPTNRCIPRKLSLMAEVSSRRAHPANLFPRFLLQSSDHLASASPAGQGAPQPPPGFSQGPSYGETPNNRTSVPPVAPPTSATGTNKRRSERDDDRHGSSDRHSRQPRR